MSPPSAPPQEPMLRFRNPAGLYDPVPNGYSHLAIVRAPAQLILVAGQGGEDANGQLPADFAGQVRQALQNLQTALRAAGAGLGDVARITVLIVDHSEERLHQFGQAWQSLLGDLPPPPCTLIPVPRLALDGMLFEIEATAATSP
ncbi:RidA family protein [Pseudoxanthomonas wuyuanensis]|uniref:Enamine deaminase RidA, house cleaning of reactive enamine intermediates, YjgF/YER057c/UK114 family n=2 Tax=Pseudoxanthomonas wuyuanensis TaxID=1073196 RepID=A0A286D2X5_9GAMM|nr:RidA family protein [Pseudoxanthomonas wuyuanensis]SOD53013.1 Enamine deaminase RidA, house cleaning of reactive enamine intermediates, YjgF/YER057c/UK114 family [Pseudoxanthomonas wuyuanensis]